MRRNNFYVERFLWTFGVGGNIIWNHFSLSDSSRFSLPKAEFHQLKARSTYQAWVRETDEQMARLIRGQDRNGVVGVAPHPRLSTSFLDTLMSPENWKLKTQWGKTNLPARCYVSYMCIQNWGPARKPLEFSLGSIFLGFIVHTFLWRI